MAGHGRRGCRRRRDRRRLLRWTGADVGAKLSNFITQTANFPLVALTQINQLVNETRLVRTALFEDGPREDPR